MKNLFNWIVVIPGALLAGLLMTFPLHWILYFTLAHGETISGMNTDPIERFLNPFVIATSFVLAGSAIAPKKKFQTSMVLAAIWIISYFAILVFWNGVFFEWRGIGGIVGALIGVVIAYFRSGKETDEAH